MGPSSSVRLRVKDSPTAFTEFLHIQDGDIASFGTLPIRTRLHRGAGRRTGIGQLCGGLNGNGTAGSIAGAVRAVQQDPAVVRGVQNILVPGVGVTLRCQ